MRITNVLLVTLGIALGFATSVGVVLGVGEVALLPAIQTIGSTAVAFSAIVAFCVYLSNIRRHRQEDKRKASETFLKESTSLLDRAYEIFVQDGMDPPANDRLLWLSTARMIVRFQKMRKRISEADHIAVVDENEEYARGRFSSLLRQNQDNFSREYFCSSSDLYCADNVSRKALVVVFGFARWREDIPDPLSEVDDIELLARGALPIDQYGAESYLEGYEDYWRKVQERKAQIGDPSTT
ncbi:MAG: hypothetical protein IT510_14350 [Sulfuritalea sp.]|nr:hypothetical protein [Sulfuritalea sp.]